jgi:hypothetical protein
MGIPDIKGNGAITSLIVYPNPANNKVTVEFPKVLILNGEGKLQGTKELFEWKSTLLEIFNLEGKEVFLKEIPKSQRTLEIDVSSWGIGLYYFRLVYDKQIVGKQKVVMSAQ